MTKHAYEDDYLWDTANAGRVDMVRSSLPDVLTSGETVVLRGRPQFKSAQRIHCPNCGKELRRGTTTLVFKHGAPDKREQQVEGWVCQCGEAYVPGEIAERAYRCAMGFQVVDDKHGMPPDGGAVRQELERLLKNVEGTLEKRQEQLNERMTRQLQDYFDTQNARFHERVERLIQQDGELQQVLRRNIGTEDTALWRTFFSHHVEESPLVNLFDSGEDNDLLAELQTVVEERLRDQRDRVLEQFSLDNKEGALCQFLQGFNEQYGGVSPDLHEKIDEAVGEFSLDDESSALSRLVGRVKDAQETNTKEFSLYEDREERSFREEVELAIRELQAGA